MKQTQSKPTFRQELAQLETTLDLEDTMSFASQCMEIHEAFDTIKYHSEDYQAGFERAFWLGRELMFKCDTEQQERSSEGYRALREKWEVNDL